MVAAVRRGRSLRLVARRFGVSLRTVQHWVRRAQDLRLDRVDWTDHRARRGWAPNRTAPALEAQVLQLRQRLRQSVLGETGAIAIAAALQAEGEVCPSVRTIGRILVRHGQVERRHRLRHPAPPPGWHLPAVAARRSELDLFDYIEMLKLASGPLFDVLTSVALHGAGMAAWPLRLATTTTTVPCFQAHWQALGCPGFVQFDNDTRFQGAHQHPDVFGRVVRFCLALGVTPVFVPPYEFGLQNAVESFNALWQRFVWQRATYATFAAVQAASARYVAARCAHRALRASLAPPRRPWQPDFVWDPRSLPAGCVVYIRRTTADGRLRLLGHTWRVAAHWAQRLVRAEVHLADRVIRCYALSRRAPAEQPLLAELRYVYPRKDLIC